MFHIGCYSEMGAALHLVFYYARWDYVTIIVVVLVVVAKENKKVIRARCKLTDCE